MAQKYRAKLSDKYYLSDNNRFLYAKFELIEPNRFEFDAGQYVSLKINEKGERRSYSIASTPDETHGFHLLIEMIGEGKGSNFLSNLELGQEVEVLAPLGRFVVEPKTDLLPTKRLFVATGSGIVPIWSMINDLLINKHEITPIRLHWGMKNEESIFFEDNLERLAEAHPNFVYDIVLSQPSTGWELCQGHVQDCLKRDFESRELEKWEGYVCGNQEVVIDICKYLESAGMHKDKIHHEKFT